MDNVLEAGIARISQGHWPGFRAAGCNISIVIAVHDQRPIFGRTWAFLTDTPTDTYRYLSYIVSCSLKDAPHFDKPDSISSCNFGPRKFTHELLNVSPVSHFWMGKDRKSTKKEHKGWAHTASKQPRVDKRSALHHSGTASETLIISDSENSRSSKPSQPIGDHPVWTWPIPHEHNFDRNSYMLFSSRKKKKIVMANYGCWYSTFQFLSVASKNKQRAIQSKCGLSLKSQDATVLGLNLSFDTWLT